MLHISGAENTATIACAMIKSKGTGACTVRDEEIYRFRENALTENYAVITLYERLVNPNS
jgi:hypothetical protein